MKREKVLGIDFVRVCALILIFIYHFNIYGEEIKVPIISSGSLGAVGVGLYLLISGAVLAYNYDDDLNIISFYKKRVLTLMLPFWIAYIMVWIYNFFFDGIRKDLPLWRYIYTLLGMDGWFSYKIPTFYLLGEWFLGFIIVCYLLFPLYLKCIKRVPYLFFSICGVAFVYASNNYHWEMPLLWNPLILTPFFGGWGILCKVYWCKNKKGRNPYCSSACYCL